MAKEWILNSATNRFQLNFKRNVGAVSEEIRKCAPKSLDDWESYYFSNVRSKEHIEELGRRLYIKITEVITAEVDQISEDDCVQYILNLVIDRTYDGYTTEIKTVYGQLEKELGRKIEPASDQWDRLFNVDFHIQVGNKYIGLQIKPAGSVSHIPQIFKEKTIQQETHKKFTEKFGGKVFYIISIKEGNKKIIHNKELIQEIREEIGRLSSV
ncbi:MAG: MjaI family restriction endonuclease [Phycisphaerae bacterium]|nr:MjaI family restriction endonuclease [Phycisphaerae bacterium]